MSKKEQKRENLIGVFDSGFGGLDILRAITQKMPYYKYIYLGDSARAPYGTRSQSTVLRFTEQAVDFLLEKNCSLIILACNTSSAEALRKIQKKYLLDKKNSKNEILIFEKDNKKYVDKKILGVIIPAVEEAIQKTKKNRIGVIATQGTIQSNAFVREVKKLKPAIKVFQKSCPLLVPIVEEGENNSEIVKVALKKYLKFFDDKDIDTLILGCTHYGFLEQKIKQILGKKINLISEGKVVSKKLFEYLNRHPEIENKLFKNYSKNCKIEFLTTDLTEKFQVLGSRFFRKKIKIKQVELF